MGMTTTTAQDITADIQDLIYSVQHGARRAATLDQVMDALMPLVERYATAKASPLRAQLWGALGMPFVNFPEQWSDAGDRAVEGQKLRAILSLHLQDD